MDHQSRINIEQHCNLKFFSAAGEICPKAAWVYGLSSLCCAGHPTFWWPVTQKKVSKCESDELSTLRLSLARCHLHFSAVLCPTGQTIYQSESAEYVINWQEARRQWLVSLAESVVEVVAVQTASNAVRCLVSTANVSSWVHTPVLMNVHVRPLNLSMEKFRLMREKNTLWPCCSV